MELSTVLGAVPVPDVEKSMSLLAYIQDRAALSQLPISQAGTWKLQHGGRKVHGTCTPGQG